MYRVDEAICIGCGDCVDMCPAGAVVLVNGRARIDDVTCVDCGSCASVCPQGAIAMAEAASPADPVVRSHAGLIAITPVMTAAEGARLADRADTESRALEIGALPGDPRRSRLWPMVGAGILWAARELLPAVLQAWQQTSGRTGGTLTPVRRLAGGGGESAGGRRNRWRYSGQRGAGSQSGSGSPNRNGC